ncbi:MAG: 2-oxoacid:acceptor oxidoreductase family protein [Candidatus Gastranaerophilales bacterium]|nr:2-oxoacid:acceptor oxidoreductase family protein [Candidatus Gastranaerophilales bacterium]
MEMDLIVSGFGGQGVLLTGVTLAYSAIIEGKNTTWIPAYGGEMRGGTANCSVNISEDEIASPYIENPLNVIALNTPSMLKFEHKIKPDGNLIVNSSIVEEKPSRKDINYIFIPVTDIAKNLGEPRCANMVALGALVEKTRVVKFENILSALAKVLPPSKANLIAINRKALESGAEFVKNLTLAKC